MKKLVLFLFITGLFTGCSIEDDNQQPKMDVWVPIQSVEMPDNFEKGKSFSVDLIYERPTRCHVFSGINKELVGSNELFFGVINSYDPTNPNCHEEEGLTGDIGFSIDLGKEEFYIFNFWQGVDENDEPVFLTIEVPASDSENAVKKSLFEHKATHPEM